MLGSPLSKVEIIARVRLSCRSNALFGASPHSGNAIDRKARRTANAVERGISSYYKSSHHPPTFPRRMMASVEEWVEQIVSGYKYVQNVLTCSTVSSSHVVRSTSIAKHGIIVAPHVPQVIPSRDEPLDHPPWASNLMFTKISDKTRASSARSMGGYSGVQRSSSFGLFTEDS